MRFLLAFSVLVATVVAGCSQMGGSAVDFIPRRHAYPRVEPYSTATQLVSLAPFAFKVAAEAHVDRTGEHWLDISYPRYGAVLHISASRFKDSKEALAAIDNRRQRISLNIGAALARSYSFQNDAGLSCEISVCAEGVATPVQFIAYDAQSSMLSAAFVINGPITPTDSIRPIINLLQDEAFTILSSLTD